MKRRKNVLAIAGLLALLLGLLWSSLPARALEKEALKRDLHASVKLIILDANGEVFGGCSGTILNNQGYILTNFHCVGQTDIYGPDEEFGLAHGDLYNPQGLLGVAITDDPRQMPVPSYIAQYIAGNPEQDVAVIKIIADLDGNLVPETLPLVPAVLIDSDQVELGEAVSVIGYPGVGGETVTFTEGKIAGFLDEDGDKLTDWFKTDVLINGGNSGGTAVNEKGEMIGIPSASTFDASRGDALRFIKPVNQAMPIIERALNAGSSQTEVGGVSGGKGGDTIASGQNFGEITFGAGFDKNGIVGASSTFKSGVAEVHAAVPYQKMRNGASWGYIWQYEGQDAIVETKLKWDQDDSGVLDLSIYSDDVLPDGNFSLQIILNDKVVQQDQFVIGSEDPTETDKPQKPPEAQSEGVLLTGRIVDYDTGKPIADAAIVILQPGKTVADFDAADDVNKVILSAGMTDADGKYITLVPLPRGQVYSVIAGKKGYQRLALDDALEISPDDPDVVELEDIGLQRQ